MFGKIIAALDTAENCTPIFENARSLAQATGAALRLVSVLKPRYDYGASFPYYPSSAGYAITMEDGYWDACQKQYADLKAENFRTLSRLSNQASASGVQTALCQRSGDPGAVICELASTEKADLIVVGSHRRRGLEEFLMGSVSSYVMHRAPCSVMVVHRLAEAENPAEKLANASSDARKSSLIKTSF